MADVGPRNQLLVEPGANPYPQYNIVPTLNQVVPGVDQNDFTDRYNTQLSPAEEQQFQQWAQSNGRARDTYDYDLRGAWKSGAATAPNGHLPDTYKKPNHPTFSDQSQYHGREGFMGGTWGGGDGQPDTFTPGPTNLQMQGPQGLQRYFQQREPDVRLMLPGQDTSNPRMADTWRRTPDMADPSGYSFGQAGTIPMHNPPGTYTGLIPAVRDNFGSTALELPEEYYKAKEMMGGAPQQMNQLLQAAYLRRGYRT